MTVQSAVMADVVNVVVPDPPQVPVQATQAKLLMAVQVNCAVSPVTTTWGVLGDMEHPPDNTDGVTV